MQKKDAIELISNAIDTICDSPDPWGRICIEIDRGEVKHVDITISHERWKREISRNGKSVI